MLRQTVKITLDDIDLESEVLTNILHLVQVLHRSNMSMCSVPFYFSQIASY